MCIKSLAELAVLHGGKCPLKCVVHGIHNPLPADEALVNNPVMRPFRERRRQLIVRFQDGAQLHQIVVSEVPGTTNINRLIDAAKQLTSCNSNFTNLQLLTNNNICVKVMNIHNHADFIVRHIPNHAVLINQTRRDTGVSTIYTLQDAAVADAAAALTILSECNNKRKGSPDTGGSGPGKGKRGGAGGRVVVKSGSRCGKANIIGRKRTAARGKQMHNGTRKKIVSDLLATVFSGVATLSDLKALHLEVGDRREVEYLPILLKAQVTHLLEYDKTFNPSSFLKKWVVEV